MSGRVDGQAPRTGENDFLHMFGLTPTERRKWCRSSSGAPKPALDATCSTLSSVVSSSS